MHDIYFRDRFLEVNYFDERQRRKIYESLNRIYNDYVFRGKHGQLTEEEFVIMHERDFKADKDAFKEKMRICGELIYGICDFTGKGSLTEEEFVHAVTLGNMEHLEKVKAIFYSYNPFGGDISVKILIEAWVQFSTCEDNTKQDIIKDGLETTVNGT